MKKPLTLFENIWDAHIVAQDPGSPAVLYIDLHLIHEVTSPQAFNGLRDRGLKARRPDRTIATVDHGIPTLSGEGIEGGRLSFADELCQIQIKMLEKNCLENGIRFYGLDSPNQGIVHVIGPELGLTQPGMTIVCGDSHTATHGAFGALAFGIGTSEVEHVLATQCLLQRKPMTFAVLFNGILPAGVTSKDMILALISKIGVGGATGHVLEYRGNAIENLNMEQRMTICNMSIECGARAGMVAPDDVTFEYIANKEYAPKGANWDQQLANWRTLPTAEGAIFDQSITINVSELEPMITYGTNPGMGMSISGRIPLPEEIKDSNQRSALVKSLEYMGLQPGIQLLGHPVDVVFIGSCTNSRISDLRQAAGVLKDRRVSPDVRVLVVPGSQEVKKQAEMEGLDRIFLEAGADWREAGCSMCIAMNGDQLNPGQYAVSTSNRNFEGRQGKGGRTFLASPLTAAATALTGKITDIRTFLTNGNS